MKSKNVLALIWMAAAMLTSIVRAGNPELPLDLGSAGDFVILAKTGISTVPSADIKGDMGVSPILATAITGFSLIMDSSGEFSTSAQVTGRIYAPDYANSTPAKMTAAISDMEAAYTAAAGRTIPDATELMAGDISGLTLTPGLYKWSTQVLINQDVWLDAGGNADAIFIFQIEGDLTMAGSKKVILSGGAQAKNIFWQVGGGAGAVIGTYAHFEGIVMTAKAIDMQTGASFNGKLLAQSAVTLNQNNIVDANLIPPPLVQLEIVSVHSTGTPSTGVYVNVMGSLLTNSITPVETMGGTQYVNTGWSMIGNVPESGPTNSMSMTHTNDAVLTWLWSTNYLLNASADPGGSVTGDTNGFYAAGALVNVTAVPVSGASFAGWTGNLSGPTNNLTQSMTMDQARTVVAHFTLGLSNVILEIVSAHGTGTPATGVYVNVIGNLLTNSITPIETMGGTQYVNTGWSMIGNAPESGPTNSMSMTHTNDAVLTWLWSTNYMLNAFADPGGSLTGSSNGFYTAGSTTSVTAAPGLGYTFDGWEVNGINFGAGVALTITPMDEAKNVTAVFSPDFVDVSSNVDWNVTWEFNPRLGYFLGTLTITNTSTKILLAPFWFEVESTTNHWLRWPTGFDAGTGKYYTNITYAVTNQLSDSALDPGESVTVMGIELMGRREPTNTLVMAVWADPPGTLSMPVDTDGDGMPDVDEYIAGTSATDPGSVFHIRLGADQRSILWDTLPNRIYTVLISTNLIQGFTAVPNTIDGTGASAAYTAQPQAAGNTPKGAVFYKVEVQIK
ncbi:MAG: ice-binding family protein [Kiritimatiellae bacterium]|jgi:hypothetical protein|nr:ice-binding family protein [Kiritimatiellia bacterium]